MQKNLTLSQGLCFPYMGNPVGGNIVAPRASWIPLEGDSMFIGTMGLNLGFESLVVLSNR